ncbi:MAG TPA: protein kinase [Gemmataceae bacterium]|nr:protein kinase [Gemmataceae bacterium]
MSAQPLTPGTRFGRYEVVAHLATGGMGEVYRARDVELQRDVALKVLPADMVDNASAVERFRREARHAARLSHKNIVTLYDWGQDGGTWFLALEFIDGTDLATRISVKGRLDPREAWVVTVQAARALEHAHQQGIVHRDVKPSNFLLTRQGGKLRVKLTDLGLARARSDEQFRVTRDGTTVGTIDYLAPEQARDSALADIRSDIYSLGCTLYHMLAGHPPFPDGGLGERLLKHLQADPPDVRQFNPDVPDTLWAVLQRMLAKEPEDRYQTPAELLDALRPVSTTGPADRSALAELESGPATPRPILPPPATDAGAPTLLEVLGLSAEDRRAAAAQYQRARAALAGGGTDMRHAYGLLVSSCTLDPTNTVYRRAVRRIGKKLGRPRGAAAARAREQLTAAQVAGDHRKMLEYGEAVLVEAPDDMPTHLAMAEAAAALGLAQLQVWLLEQACKEAPNNPEPARLLARAHEKQKHLGKAIAVWQALRKARPNDTEAPRKLETLLRLLARAYERKNDRPGAIAVWRAVLKLRPQDSEASRQITALSGDDTGAGRKADA